MIEISEVTHTTQLNHTAKCGEWEVKNDAKNAWIYFGGDSQTMIGEIKDAKELHAALTKYIELVDAEGTES